MIRLFIKHMAIQHAVNYIFTSFNNNFIGNKVVQYKSSDDFNEGDAFSVVTMSVEGESHSIYNVEVSDVFADGIILSSEVNGSTVPVFNWDMPDVVFIKK